MLKKRCRRHGVRRWPHRKLKSLDKLKEKLEREEAVSTDKQYYEAEIHSIVQEKDMLFRSETAKQNDPKSTEQNTKHAIVVSGNPVSPAATSSLLSSGMKANLPHSEQPGGPNYYVSTAHAAAPAHQAGSHLYPHAQMHPSAAAFHMSLCGMYGCDCFATGGISSQGFHPPIVGRAPGPPYYGLQPSPVPPYPYSYPPYAGSHPLSMVQVNVLEPSQQACASSMSHMASFRTAAASPLLREPYASTRDPADGLAHAQTALRRGDYSGTDLMSHPNAPYAPGGPSYGSYPGHVHSALPSHNYAFASRPQPGHALTSSSSVSCDQHTVVNPCWSEPAHAGLVPGTVNSAHTQIADLRHHQGEKHDKKDQTRSSRSNCHVADVKNACETKSSGRNGAVVQDSKVAISGVVKSRERASRKSQANSNLHDGSPDESSKEIRFRDCNRNDFTERENRSASPAPDVEEIAETLTRVREDASKSREKLSAAIDKGSSSKETTPNDSSPSSSDENDDNMSRVEMQNQCDAPNREDELTSGMVRESDVNSTDGRSKKSSVGERHPPKDDACTIDSERKDVCDRPLKRPRSSNSRPPVPTSEQGEMLIRAATYSGSDMTRHGTASASKKSNCNDLHNSIGDIRNSKDKSLAPRSLPASAPPSLENHGKHTERYDSTGRGRDSRVSTSVSSDPLSVDDLNLPKGLENVPLHRSGKTPSALNTGKHVSKLDNDSLPVVIPCCQDSVPPDGLPPAVDCGCSIHSGVTSRAKRYDHTIHQCSTLRTTMWSVDWNLQVTSAIGPKILLGYAGVPCLGKAIMEGSETAVESSRTRREQYLMARKGERLERMLGGPDGERFLHILTPIRKRGSSEIVGVSGMLVELMKGTVLS